MTSIQQKLSEKLAAFLNSPYRGEWNQNCAITLSAGELRILVAHPATYPIDEEDCKQRLGDFGTVEAAKLLSGGY